ncbi:MAG TPA: hypothetical protein VH370_24020 [Humisphaera sp.]|jgi:hypothetical protein|nr:hypothetical protein [Humisphaera sp.]
MSKRKAVEYTFKFLSIMELKPDWTFAEHYFEIIKSHKARQAWWEQRQLKLEDHSIRISTELPEHEPRPAKTHRGRARGVWCVQLRRRFASLSSAAKFVGRSTSNIARAIADHGRSGGYQWEHFNPERHAHRRASR